MPRQGGSTPSRPGAPLAAPPQSPAQAVTAPASPADRPAAAAAPSHGAMAGATRHDAAHRCRAAALSQGARRREDSGIVGSPSEEP